ncbi:DoxX family protein [Pontiella sp.]|uniref:DoxX family protein n=1 Tax=Pontiella sp. TaxID=2837462 RepID=UPI0035615A8D
MSMLLIFLKAVTSLAFVSAGIAKQARAKPLVEQFHDFRLPLEIMLFIGILEILGAIALWFESLTVWVLSALAFLMLGALKNHIEARHPFTRMLPALALFCLCVWGALLANWLN